MCTILKDKKMFLFVCTGNTCRSPMAEAIFNKKAKEIGIDGYVYACSCGIGVFEGGPMSLNSLEVLKNNHIEADGFFAKQITREMYRQAHVVLTMTTSHKDVLMQSFGDEKVFTLLEYTKKMSRDFVAASLDIDDPYGADYKTYKAVYCEIDRCLEIILNTINKEIKS